MIDSRRPATSRFPSGVKIQRVRGPIDPRLHIQLSAARRIPEHCFRTFTANGDNLPVRRIPSGSTIGVDFIAHDHLFTFVAVQNPHRSSRAGGIDDKEVISCRRKLHARHATIHFADFPQRAAADRFDQPQRIEAERQHCPVRRKRQRADGLRRFPDLAGIEIPDERFGIRNDAKLPPACGEAQLLNPDERFREAARFFPGRQVPQPYGFVIDMKGQRFAVGSESNAPGVTFFFRRNGANHLAGRQAPQANRAIVASQRQNVAPRRQRKTRNRKFRRLDADAQHRRRRGN